MGRKKKSDQDGLLTPLELEIMSALWKLGLGNVHDVIEALGSEKSYAYNTVSTILRLLLEKDVVAAESQGRVHIYRPVLSKQDYEARTLDHVVTTVFDGEPASLLRRLIDNDGLSDAELKEIKSLLEAKGVK